MSVQVLFWTFVGLFLSAAAGGLSMAGIRPISCNRSHLAWLTMLHGVLATAGLRDSPCKGDAHHARSGDPQHEIKSDKSNHVAVRERGAPNKSAKQA